MANRKLHLRSRHRFVVLLRSGFACALLFAGSEAPAQEFEYPELQVAPRASERLQMEAARGRSFISAFWPFQVSGVTTLATGVIHLLEEHPRNDPDNEVGWAGVAVGGGWLLGTALLHSMYEPYEDALGQIKALPARTKREQLVRERMAEEAIRSASKAASRLAWISAGTNLAANLAMLSRSDGETVAQLGSAIGIGVSLLPLLFENRWERVADEQREYKKKIYSPIASMGVLPAPRTGKASPGLQLAWRF